MARSKIYVNVIKSILDVVIALFLILLLSPFLVLVTIAVLIDAGRSPIFRQPRVGKNERVFVLYKFRTMKEEGEELRITRFGKFLRSVSIDELPQLFNILKREMSFIGPRPLLTEYLQYYNDQEKKRHNVNPGITGWAQVNGRNELDWGSRMEMDLYYVNHISPILDMKILFLTIVLLTKRDSTPYENSPIVKFSEFASKRDKQSN